MARSGPWGTVTTPVGLSWCRRPASRAPLQVFRSRRPPRPPQQSRGGGRTSARGRDQANTNRNHQRADHGQHPRTGARTRQGLPPVHRSAPTTDTQPHLPAHHQPLSAQRPHSLPTGDHTATPLPPDLGRGRGSPGRPAGTVSRLIASGSSGRLEGLLLGADSGTAVRSCWKDARHAEAHVPTVPDQVGNPSGEHHRQRRRSTPTC